MLQFALAFFVWQQPTTSDHPWELRLRAVERNQAKESMFGDQVMIEAKAIIENRTKRIEELEHKFREMERALADGDDPATKADEAKAKAEEVSAKIDAVVEKSDPWAMVITAMGGSAGVSAMFTGLVVYLVRRLRSELVQNAALPTPGKPAESSGVVLPLVPHSPKINPLQIQ